MKRKVTNLAAAIYNAVAAAAAAKAPSSGRQTYMIYTTTERELLAQATAIDEMLDKIEAVAPTYLNDAVVAQVNAVSAMVVEDVLLDPELFDKIALGASKSPKQKAALRAFSAILERLRNAPEGSPLREADLTELATVLSGNTNAAVIQVFELLMALRRANVGMSTDLSGDAAAAPLLAARIQALAHGLVPFLERGTIGPHGVPRIGKSARAVEQAALFGATRRAEGERAKATGQESRFLTEIVNAFGIQTLRIIGTGSVTDIELQRAALLVDYIADKIARPLIVAVCRKEGSYHPESVQEFVESTFTDLAEAMRTAGEKPSVRNTEALQYQIVVFEKAWRKFGGGLFGTLTPRQLLLRAAVEALVTHTIRFVERPRATETDTLGVLLSETLDKAADLGLSDVETLVDDLVDDVALPASAIR